ncbi:MAG: GNAT family N-acetyltransferase [Anaerolineae bacterium]|nr:GNAT family N-acetyltransferase [Anaerolineae bacterium]
MEFRAFNGTLRDAQGLIEVDGETFGDCTYAAQTIVNLLADPVRWVGVAVEDALVVGFVSCFRTQSLRADRWEVDELAVRPAYQGRGIGTRLVAYAVAQGTAHCAATAARAVIAVANRASERAFARSGFHPTAEVDLVLYEVSGRVPRPILPGAPAVRVANVSDAPALAALSGRPPERAAALLSHHDNVYLVARKEERTLGYAELVYVRTLQYQGFWIESLATVRSAGRALRALVAAAIEEAKRRPEADVVGHLVPRDDGARYRACVSEGFALVEHYVVHERALHEDQAALGAR